MKIEEFNPGHSFRIGGTTHKRLCRYIARLPGVSFTRRRSFFWSYLDVGAEFTFRGHKFLIDTDRFDYALWVLTADQQSHLSEMQALCEHIQAAARLATRLVAVHGLKLCFPITTHPHAQPLQSATLNGKRSFRSCERVPKALR